jgi:hypothetical protein
MSSPATDSLPSKLRAAVEEILAARGGLPLSRPELSALEAVYEDGEWAERGLSSFWGCPMGLLGREVELSLSGGLAVRTPTLAALILLELADGWPAPDAYHGGEWPLLLRAWACVHGSDRRALARASVSATACSREVLSWTMQTGALDPDHIEALRSAVGAVWSSEMYAHLRHDPPSEQGADAWRPKAAAWHAILLRLVRGAGSTLSQWLYDVPESRAFWILRALDDSDRAGEMALNPKAAARPDDPRIIAREAWEKLEKCLTEKPKMRTRQVPVSDGRTVTVREMTFGEMRQVRDQEKSAALPATWPLEVQFADRQEELDALPANDVFSLAEAVYDLTYGQAKAVDGQQTGG